MQPLYDPFSKTTRVSRCQKKSSSGLCGVQGAISKADTSTMRQGATPIGLINDPPPSPSIFTPDALHATTLPIYPGFGQAPNMPACIPSGLVTLSIMIIIIRPHCSTSGLLLETEQQSVCWYVSVTTTIPAKTAVPIKTPFGMWTWVGPRNCVLDRGPDPQGSLHFCEGWRWNFPAFYRAHIPVAMTSGCLCMPSTSNLTGQLQKQSTVALNFPNEKSLCNAAFMKILWPLIINIITALFLISTAYWSLLEYFCHVNT